MHLEHHPFAPDWKDDHPKSRHRLSDADVGELLVGVRVDMKMGKDKESLYTVIFNPIDSVCPSFLDLQDRIFLPIGNVIP